MPRAKVDAKTKSAILQAYQRGDDLAKLAQMHNVGVGTIQNWAYLAGVRRPKVDAQDAVAPPNVPIDSRETDGSVSIVTPDRPLTLDEVYDLFKVDRTEWVAQTIRTNQWNSFYKIKEGGHQKVVLWQTRVVFTRVVAKEIQARLQEWFQEHVDPLPKRSLPTTNLRDHMHGQTVVWGLWDAHLGMYAWNAEVGADYDLSIATNRVKNSVDDMIEELHHYPIKQIIMPVGNDFCHFDTVRQTTTYGDHFLDCDTRYAKVFVAALECLAYMVERALEISQKMHVVYVPGNHDHATSFSMCVALQQRYRNEPRITFDLRPNPRKYVTFGTVIIGFDHGKDVRPEQYSLIYGTEPGAKEAWSKSTWREVQIGHTHQRREKMYEGLVPTNGLLVRTNPSLSNVDYWHHSSGLIGEPVKSVEAWRYDDRGYVGSHVAWARDETRN